MRSQRIFKFINRTAQAAVAVLLFALPAYAQGWSVPKPNIVTVHAGERIQTAIDKAKKGTVILVSPGTYYEIIHLKSGVHLRSEQGADKTIIDGHGSQKPVVVCDDKSILEGFTITGKGKPKKEGDPSHAIECLNGSATIKNDIVRDNQGTGIYTAGEKTSPEILYNKVYNNQGAGIANKNKSRAHIKYNECYQNASAGIAASEGASPVIENNISHHNELAGIGVRDKGTSAVIKGNRCYLNGRSGVGVQKGGSATLEGNTLTSNGRAGIGGREGVTVNATGNTIIGNTLSGVGMLDKCKVVLKDNTLSNNVMAGVTLMDGTQGVIIGNIIQENGTQGIVCTRSIAKIQKNTVLNNHHHGISVYRGSEAEIIENTIHSNGEHDTRGAAIIVVSKSKNVIIRNNSFAYNYGPGVYARSSFPIIQENKFTNDLVFVKKKAAPIIERNVFYTAGKSGGKKAKGGVDVRDHSNPIIRNNEFYGKFAVSTQKGSRPKIIGNIFSGNHKGSIRSGRSGIKIIGDALPHIERNIFYNGNLVALKGKYITENQNYVLRRRRFVKSPADAELPKDTKLILMERNLFLK